MDGAQEENVAQGTDGREDDDEEEALFVFVGEVGDEGVDETAPELDRDG